MTFPREIVTTESFPHGLTCASCGGAVPNGDAVCSVPLFVDGRAREEVPVVPLAEVYAQGATDDRLFVVFCAECANKEAS